MDDKQHDAIRPAALMVGARLLSLAMGVLTIPILIRCLGGNGFAAWAVLLALAAGFTMLEFGMPICVVRFLAVPARDGNWHEARMVLGRVWLILAVSYGTGLIAVIWLAAPFAVWLGLPDTAIFSAPEAIYWVFAGAAIKAFLQTGMHVLYAARRFSAISVISLMQALCSHLAAILSAWKFGRLDIALIAYWSTQLCVLGIVFVLLRRRCLPRFGRATLDAPRMRELCLYGLTSQMDGWAYFVNFQFDKFIVAGLVGLWGVAAYEVANRAVAALRGIPTSGMETFLPTAMTVQASQEDAWAWYVASTRITAYGVCAFMLAPLAVSPMALYAWTGEMGFLGTGTFVALITGTTASVLAYPAVNLLQALGRPGVQAGAAAVSILVNVPLSLLLVMQWGLVGAAIGTATAMVISAGQVLLVAHKQFNRPLRATLRVLADFWPLLLTCLCWWAATDLLFGAWFATLNPGSRFSHVNRIYPGILTVAIYAMCLLSMFLVQMRRGAFTAEERSFLARMMSFRWFTEQNIRRAKR